MYAMPAVFSIIATVRDRVLVLDLVSARGSASRAAPHTSRTLRSRRPIIASTPRSSRSQQPSQGSSAADVMCSWKLPSEPGGRRPFRLPAQVSSIVYDSFHAFVSLVDPSNATPQPFNPSTPQPLNPQERLLEHHLVPEAPAKVKTIAYGSAPRPDVSSPDVETRPSRSAFPFPFFPPIFAMDFFRSAAPCASVDVCSTVVP